ncbi:hypothetical protein EDM80_09095 [bacterium]|nr:MAG: hypothetical protein EDM80_09095 [bacterium]
MRLPNPKEFPFKVELEPFSWPRGSDAEHAAALDWFAIRKESLEAFRRYNSKKEDFRKAFEDGAAAQFAAYRARLVSEGDPKLALNAVIRFCQLLKPFEPKIVGE